MEACGVGLSPGRIAREDASTNRRDPMSNIKDRHIVGSTCGEHAVTRGGDPQQQSPQQHPLPYGGINGSTDQNFSPPPTSASSVLSTAGGEQVATEPQCQRQPHDGDIFGQHSRAIAKVGAARGTPPRRDHSGRCGATRGSQAIAGDGGHPFVLKVLPALPGVDEHQRPAFRLAELHESLRRDRCEGHSGIHRP